MVEPPARPAGCGVAIIARITALDVISGLALSDLSIVAAGTAPRYRAVIDKRHRRPLIGVVVAGLARIVG